MESTSIGKPTGIQSLKHPLKIGLFLILLASWSFLTYKFLTFHQYKDLTQQWKQMPLTRLWWLTGVFLLLPLNWFFESVKWRLLTSHVQKFTLYTSLQAVLSGISTGFFTPNRVGELIGRIAFLEPGNRKAGVTLSMMNSLTQTVIMGVCGIPACLMYFTTTTGKWHPDLKQFILLGLGGILLLVTAYHTMPFWYRQFNKSRWSAQIKSFTACLSYYSRGDIFQIMLVSLLRYMVFNVQFYWMLQFFGISLTPWQSLMAIPTTYLFVTFTPALAFSEAAVRGSYAVLIIGAFSNQVIGIALTGVCLWFVNFVLPMLAGSVIMLKKK